MVQISVVNDNKGDMYAVVIEARRYFGLALIVGLRSFLEFTCLRVGGGSCFNGYIDCLLAVLYGVQY